MTTGIPDASNRWPSSGGFSSTEIRKPMPPQPSRWRTVSADAEKSASDRSFAAAAGVMVRGASTIGSPLYGPPREASGHRRVDRELRFGRRRRNPGGPPDLRRPRRPRGDRDRRRDRAEQ